MLVLRGEPHRQLLGVVRIGVHRGVRGTGCRIGEPGRCIGDAVQDGHCVVHARGGAQDQVVAADGVGKRRQQRLRVRENRRIVGVVPVHEPRGELEFGVEARARAQEAVRCASAGRDVGVEDVAGSSWRRRKPLQVDGRVANGDAVPVDDTDDRGNAAAVLEEEARG